MSTRSTIGIKLEDGSVKAIYCHWDGYPKHQRPLLKHYNTKEKVEELIALGSLSILGEEIGVKHPFDAVIKKDDDVTEKLDAYTALYGKMCKCYHRDRGEDWEDVKPVTFSNTRKWKSDMRNSSCEYSYLFSVKTGKWTSADLTQMD